jgi:hypothetical protein
MNVRIKKVNTSIAHTLQSVSGSSVSQTSIRSFRLNDGLPTLRELQQELDEYVAVIMGREAPPINNGEMTLLEYANAVYSRGMELTMLIQRSEASGTVLKGSKYYKFRTGELRSFVELALKAIELGSRRITVAKMEYDMTRG